MKIKPLGFISRSILSFFGSLLLLLLLCFFVIRFFPGNPYSLQEGITDPLVLEKLNSIYPTRLSIFEQLFQFLKELVRGNLGQSLHYVGKSVNSILVENGAPTFILGGSALVISILFSVFYARISRSMNYLWWDRVLIIGYSIPLLALAPFSIWYFCFKLEWFPIAKLSELRSYFLPILLLSIKPSISLSRVLSEIIDRNLKSSYARFARANGFSQREIVNKWVLRNSLGPYFTQLATVFIGLLSGSFLIEMLFSIPGLGQQFIDSVLNRDWPLVVGLTLFYGSLVILAHILAEALSRYFDPRLRSEG